MNVSAIVSTYNSKRFFAGRMADLMGQTLYEAGQLEIVVINSGSKQDEHDTVMALLDDGARNIVYMRTLREPLYAAWNRGVRLASGRYLTNANADDRLRPDALERLARELDTHPDVGVVYGDSYVTSTPNAVWGGEYTLDYPPYYPTGCTHWPQVTASVMAERCVIGPQPMWRASVHDVVGAFDPSYLMAGDYEFWARLMVTGFKFRKVDEVIGLFYHDAGQLSRQDVPHILMETQRVQMTYGEALRG